MIVVSNISDFDVKVAINQWGSSGKTGFSEVKAGKNDKWERDDKKGFVMAIEKNPDNILTYYVFAESSILISNDCVKDRDVLINPLTNIVNSINSMNVAENQDLNLKV